MNTQNKPRLVLPESYDTRILKVSESAVLESIAEIILLGDERELQKTADKSGISLKGIEIINQEKSTLINEVMDQAKNDNLKIDEDDPVCLGSLLVRYKKADGIIGGVSQNPAQVFSTYLKILEPDDKCGTMSAFSLLSFPSSSFLRFPNIGVADTAVIPDPSPEQLAETAYISAQTYNQLTGEEPYVAFLSFSTKGSSKAPSTQIITKALEYVQQKYPTLKADGEFQLDAALVPHLAGVKAASSLVAGKANVLIFPSLNAGNIFIKAMSWFSNCKISGPVLQGKKGRVSYIPTASDTAGIYDILKFMVST